MNTESMPRIIVYFSIDGFEFPLEEFTEAIELVPARTRTRDDWPDAIKNNKSLPIELHPRCTWEIMEAEDRCYEIAMPISKVMDMLLGKEETISAWCEKYNLKSMLTVVIHAEEMRFPAIVIPSHILSYFGKMGADIGFDIYSYGQENE